MDTSTSRAPVAVARVARALTCLVYGFLLVALVGLLFGFLPLLFGGLAALVLSALVEWLTDRIAEMGCAG
jgi:predicted PurR-regulated permease PerM